MSFRDMSKELLKSYDGSKLRRLEEPEWLEVGVVTAGVFCHVKFIFIFAHLKFTSLILCEIFPNPSY